MVVIRQICNLFPQLIGPAGEGLQDKLENFLTELDGVGDWELSFISRL